VTEPATEGRSLLKDGARELRAEAMSPVSECVCRCMAGVKGTSGDAVPIATGLSSNNACDDNNAEPPLSPACLWQAG
jgi:hypothetical protein